jgi:uncharacterized RDD family membrane protein YckC
MENVKDAGLGIRLAAAAIDFVLMALPVLAGVVYYTLANGGNKNIAGWVLMILVVILWKKYGATPGKMILGLKVVSNDLQPLTYGQAFGRYFSYALSSLLLFGGFIMIAFRKDKKGLHDLLAKTRVVYKSSLNSDNN